MPLRALFGLLLCAGCAPLSAQDATRAPEPNTRVPAGVVRYAPSVFPDRIVLSPAQDAAHGFAVAWRTDATVAAPVLEIVTAGDSPDMGTPRQVRASSRELRTENGIARHHRADVDCLLADTLYAWRVRAPGRGSASRRRSPPRGR